MCIVLCIICILRSVLNSVLFVWRVIDMVWICDEMVVCVVCELIDGVYVNLGIGLLILVVNYIFDGVDVWL